MSISSKTYVYHHKIVYFLEIAPCNVKLLHIVHNFFTKIDLCRPVGLMCHLSVDISEQMLNFEEASHQISPIIEHIHCKLIFFAVYPEIWEALIKRKSNLLEHCPESQ